jgi:hypothetical protein
MVPRKRASFGSRAQLSGCRPATTRGEEDLCRGRQIGMLFSHGSDQVWLFLGEATAFVGSGWG